MRDPRHDILFEPIKIGPKTARNRLFQASHCNGAGSDRPGFQAYHRAIKAEGGWAVVGTESCEVSPDSDTSPLVSARLWDQGDVRNLSLLTEMAHSNGALASVQLFHGGRNARALESRMRGTQRGPSHASQYFAGGLTAGREMSKDDIREVQGYYVRAARLARQAGFDIICVLSEQGMDLTHQFLLPGINHRTDEYGGSLENRARFALETFEQIKEAVGEDCALTVRFGFDTLDGPHGFGSRGIRVDGDGGEFMRLADHLVDMWDLVTGGRESADDIGPSRTHPQNWNRDLVLKARKYTNKPIAVTGRFTDPNVMAEVIRTGQCDVISAARPTIADPFLPTKINEGRLDDIRECIGCNLCISRWETGGPPIVCTQNATAGEEFRRGWHPEKFEKAANAENDVLVIGAGPAGMECARVLAERGMRRVHIVDRAEELGGHVRDVARLPGLGEWARVINYRQIQLKKLRNVEIIPKVTLTKDDVLDYGADIVIVAAGSYWSDRALNRPIRGVQSDLPHVLTPDQFFGGKPVGQRVAVYDGDGYFMAAGIAEKLLTDGHEVTILTPSSQFAEFTGLTLEQPRLLRRLLGLGAKILRETVLAEVWPGGARLRDGWQGSVSEIEVDSVVIVTQRLPREELFVELRDDPESLAREGIQALYRVGDCAVPGYIVDAVFEGHRLGREIDSPSPAHPLPYIRERRLLNATDADYMLGSPTLQIERPALA